MKLDINCDLGEGIGNDAQIMPLISSCNLACGGHAGTVFTMIETLNLANKYHVKIGAHPSYPDQENFGRTVIKMEEAELTDSIFNQINALKIEAEKLGLILHHLKPHGALYNEATIKPDIAKSIVDALIKIDPKLILFAPYHSVLAKIAEKNKVTVIYEAFMDRRYNNDLTLVSRKLNEAVITDPEAVFNQLYSMASRQKVTCLSDDIVEIKAETYCIHGDNINAVSILNHIHKRCKEKNISIN